MTDLPGITATVVAAGVSILAKDDYANISSWRFLESVGNGEW